MKRLQYLVIVLAIALHGCKEESFTFGELGTPHLNEPAVAVLGSDAANPAGDGSGRVSVQVQAQDAINYKVDFGDGSAPKRSTNPIFVHTYGHTGERTFDITVTAYGPAGISASQSVSVDVLRNFEPNPELVEFLTGNASKVWVVDSLAAGHLGVGPPDGFSPDWWAAPPMDKQGMGIYDDEYVFHADGRFEHITNGSIFGKKEYLTVFDNTLTGADDFTLVGPAAANYTDQFSYDGGDTEEYIVFGGLGHLGNYVGGHRFLVLERTAETMTLKTIGADTNAWYVKIKAKTE